MVLRNKQKIASSRTRTGRRRKEIQARAKYRSQRTSLSIKTIRTSKPARKKKIGASVADSLIVVKSTS